MASRRWPGCPRALGGREVILDAFLEEGDVTVAACSPAFFSQQGGSSQRWTLVTDALSTSHMLSSIRVAQSPGWVTLSQCPSPRNAGAPQREAAWLRKKQRLWDSTWASTPGRLSSSDSVAQAKGKALGVLRGRANRSPKSRPLPRPPAVSPGPRWGTQACGC